MNLQSITLSEINQTEDHTLHDSIYMRCLLESTFIGTEGRTVAAEAGGLNGNSTANWTMGNLRDDGNFLKLDCEDIYTIG